jgi:hypothetical protein
MYLEGLWLSYFTNKLSKNITSMIFCNVIVLSIISIILFLLLSRKILKMSIPNLH